MKYLFTLLISISFLSGRSQTLINFSNWSDSVTLNNWKSQGINRIDTLNYNGYKLYSPSNQYFAELSANQGLTDYIAGSAAVQGRPLQILVANAYKCKSLNRYQIFFVFTSGTDTVLSLHYFSSQRFGEPSLDHTNKTIVWQQDIISIDSSSYYSSQMPDSVHFLIKAADGINDSSWLWIDELSFLDHHTSVNNPSQLQNISFYPNPADKEGNLLFSLPAPSSGALSLYDLSGVKVYEQSKIELHSGINHIKIPLEQLAPGIYFCDFRTAGGRATTKVQVLH